MSCAPGARQSYIGEDVKAKKEKKGKCVSMLLGCTCSASKLVGIAEFSCFIYEPVKGYRGDETTHKNSLRYLQCIRRVNLCMEQFAGCQLRLAQHQRTALTLRETGSDAGQTIPDLCSAVELFTVFHFTFKCLFM